MLTDPNDMCEPFAFDVANADYLLSSENVDLGGQRLKQAFRKCSKTEVVTLHMLREKMAI
jgi:hypothetical protein